MLVAERVQPGIDSLTTWLNMPAASTAPAANAIRPMMIQLLRPVAVYSMATNMAKNISEVPRSCCMMSTPIERSTPR